MHRAIKLLAASLVLMFGLVSSGLANEASDSGSPNATQVLDGKQLPPPVPEFGGTIKQEALQSKPWCPPGLFRLKALPMFS